MCGDFERVLESALPEPSVTAVATDHEVLREVAYWRDMFPRVRDDLDTIAAREENVKHRRWFDSRARRIRELLTEPVRRAGRR